LRSYVPRLGTVFVSRSALENAIKEIERDRTEQQRQRPIPPTDVSYRMHAVLS